MNAADAPGTTTAATTASQASLSRRLLQMLNERFPLVPSALSAWLLALTADVAGQRLRAPELPAVVDLRTVLLALFVLAVFLIVRINDDLGDAALDQTAHPERPLQRGLVTALELRTFGTRTTFVGLLAVIAAGVGQPVLPATLPWMFLCLLFVRGIAADFGLGRVLEHRPLPAALLHQQLVPLLVLTCASARVDVVTAFTPGSLAPLWPLLVFSASLGLLFEVARKTKAPADEIEGDVTYSSAYGFRAALVVCVALCAAAGASGAVLAQQVGGDGSVVALIAIAACIALLFAVNLRGLKPGADKKHLGLAALAHIALYTTLLVALLWRVGSAP